MAEPLILDRIRKAFTAEGVRYAVASDASTNNRNHVGKWGPMNGVMIHHTAGTDSLGVIRKGLPDLPGPLSQGHLSKVGLLTVVSDGRCNHAGKGSQAVYDAVLDERPLPATGPDAVDGNQHFYGLEIENKGTGHDPYPAQQYDQAVRWAAALCRANGWTERSVIGHGEWTKRKVDPSFPMNQFRKDVAERLAHPASWNGEKDPVPTTPQPEPVKPQAYKDVAETDAIPAPRNHPEAGSYWTLETYVRFIAEELIRARRG